MCGRLYCCLTFEYEAYRELRGQMPRVGSMVSTPAGEAKVNNVNVMKKTVTLWLTEQRQLMEMPAIDLQMQYGLTVRPVELVQEIEAPLRTPPPPAGAAPEVTPPGERRPDVESSMQQPADGGPKRRRRGRRGGRNRRGGGETDRPSAPPGPGGSA